jgi:hypothetical protein
MSPTVVTGKANVKRSVKTASDRAVEIPTREHLIAQLNEDVSRARSMIRGGVFR